MPLKLRPKLFLDPTDSLLLYISRFVNTKLHFANIRREISYFQTYTARSCNGNAIYWPKNLPHQATKPHNWHCESGTGSPSAQINHPLPLIPPKKSRTSAGDLISPSSTWFTTTHATIFWKHKLRILLPKSQVAAENVEKGFRVWHLACLIKISSQINLPSAYLAGASQAKTSHQHD